MPLAASYHVSSVYSRRPDRQTVEIAGLLRLSLESDTLLLSYSVVQAIGVQGAQVGEREPPSHEERRLKHGGLSFKAAVLRTFRKRGLTGGLVLGPWLHRAPQSDSDWLGFG